MAPSHGLVVDMTGPRATLHAKLLPDTRSAVVSVSGRFRGFLVQARSKDDIRVLVPGRFTPTTGARTLDCDDQDDTAITHVDNTEKTNVTAKWAAPPGWEGSVVFKATVVKTYDAYPEYVFSEDIAIRKSYETVQTASDEERLGMTAELQPNGSLELVPVMTPMEAPHHAGVDVVNRLAGRVTRATARQSSDTDPYKECGVTRGCFGLMGPCIQTKDCTVLLSYAVAPKGEGLDFELTGGHGRQEQHVDCRWNHEHAKHAVVLFLSHRAWPPSSTASFTTASQGMQESWNTDTMQNVVQTPTSAGITFGVHAAVDGHLRCSWNRQNVTVAQGKTFDIGKEKYYLLLASGPFLVDPASGKPTSPEKQMHTIRGLTAAPLLLAQAYEVKQKGEDYLPYKIHGSLMLFAWLFLVSVAIMMARHFKKDWPGVKIVDLQVWFVFHRSLMTLALVCILASLATVVTAVGGWSYGVNLHPILGVTASALAIAQPIMALFRCHSNEPRRPVFNWLHWANGNVAQSVALVTIYYAPGLTKSGLGGSGTFLTVLSLLVGFHIAVHVGMQALSALSTKPPDALIMQVMADEDRLRVSVSRNYRSKVPKRGVQLPNFQPPLTSRSLTALRLPREPLRVRAPCKGLKIAEMAQGRPKRTGPPAMLNRPARTRRKTGEAPEHKSAEEAGGSAEAAAEGGAAGADNAASAPPHPPVPADAGTASAPQAQEPASSTLDKVRVVLLAVYSLVLLGGVAALVGIVFSA
ncbi:hypothetical protein MTO96_030799 [Rhipicephalus appendiculatus]